jgi:hypothetical protein
MLHGLDCIVAPEMPFHEGLAERVEAAVLPGGFVFGSFSTALNILESQSDLFESLCPIELQGSFEATAWHVLRRRP